MRNEDSKKQDLFTRRSIFVTGAKFGLFSILLGRMIYLQMIDSDTYKMLSESNRIKASIISPLRGKILDRFDNEIATNSKQYRVIIDKERGVRFSETLEELVRILGIDENEKEELLKKYKVANNNSMVLLVDDLKWNDIARIELNTHRLPGIRVGVASARQYPYAAFCAHITGFVGSVSDNALMKSRFMSHPDTRLGKNGIEKIKNTELLGHPGLKKMEMDAKGLAIRELSSEDSIDGKNVKLSLDAGLQKFTSDLISKDGASVVLLDIKAGSILSMVSTPSFDPNILSGGVSINEWNHLITNPLLPLTNRAVSSHYPPGSTFKLVVMLAALESGIGANTKMNCTGKVAVGNRDFHCWRKSGHGELNMQEALMSSCNSYIYNIAKTVGIEAISDMAKKLGLGKKTNVELPNESSGLIPDKAWRTKKNSKIWQMGDTMNTSIGQGFVLLTPLQLAVMSARIASGKQITPSILFHKGSSDFKKLGIKENHLEIIREAMNMVVNDPRGTSFRYRIREKNLQMCGKTGTPQVVSKKNANDDYSKASVKRKLRNHGAFTGFAPFDNPRYACSVIVEHSGGPSAAVPIARDLLTEVQKKYIL